jgi:predicted DNA-binding transcriptional regulator AlpA
MKTVITIPEVLERYQIGRQSLWRWRQNRDFPNPISPSHARPFWRISDIEAWENLNAA